MTGLFIRVSLCAGTSANSPEYAAGVCDVKEPHYSGVDHAVRVALERMMADLGSQRIDELAKEPAP